MCKGLRYSTKARKGLGRHRRKDDRDRFCRGRKIFRRGYRSHPRRFNTIFGKLDLPLRVAECRGCGARYSPLLDALKIDPYRRKESNFEHEVIEAVLDTNYRRLINARSIDISLGGIHNMVVETPTETMEQHGVESADLKAIMADGTGIKKYRGQKGELRAVIGITSSGRVEPLGTFVNTEWSDIEHTAKQRIKATQASGIPFIYDGEPGLDDFLSEVAQTQRCTWHGPRGLYHALWEDGLKKKDSQPHIDTVRQLIGIELPEGDYELLKESDKDGVQRQYESSKQEIQQLIEELRNRGYQHGASYLQSLSRRLFTHVELWLKTGVIAPKTTSILERIFREIGRRLKRIAWGWSDRVVTKLSKMIILKQYCRQKWEAFWNDKLAIKGFFKIQIVSMKICY